MVTVNLTLGADAGARKNSPVVGMTKSSGRQESFCRTAESSDVGKRDFLGPYLSSEMSETRFSSGASIQSKDYLASGAPDRQIAAPDRQIAKWGILGLVGVTCLVLGSSVAHRASCTGSVLIIRRLSASRLWAARPPMSLGWPTSWARRARWTCCYFSHRPLSSES